MYRAGRVDKIVILTPRVHFAKRFPPKKKGTIVKIRRFLLSEKTYTEKKVNAVVKHSSLFLILSKMLSMDNDKII